MTITEKDVKKMSLIVLLAALAILSFLIIKPVLLSVLAGLILAYLFLPIHHFLVRLVKSKTLSAILSSILLLALIIIPLWFLLPLVSQQIFQLFKLSQELELIPLIKTVFPAASDQFISQIDIAIKSGFSKLTSSIINSTVDLLVNFVTISLHLILVAFVFFFTLKDEEKLRNFASGLLPLAKNQEKQFVKQFGDITKSILYGQVVAGLVQGTLAAIALYVFGIPNALLLSVIVIVFSIIPLIGPGIVYIPATVYMIINGNPLLAVGYFLFNVLIVSSIDNVIRAHFISTKTNLSQAIILIGMIGGLFMFNVIGLLLGPLILAYFITFIRAYKENTLSSLFYSS
jgi:predicted PurR-regulated permease PerM